MANYPNLYLDQPCAFAAHQEVWTVDRARLRAWPGLDQPVLSLVREGTCCKINYYTPTHVDGLTWWPLLCNGRSGWMAESAANGSPILSSISVTQQQQVIHQEAERLDLSHTVALAVFAIESAPNDLPGPHLILNLETHILSDNLPTNDPDQRSRFYHYFDYGSPPWADQRWRTGAGSPWLILDADQHNQRRAINFAAMIFGREAALRSTSMGPGQIMGFNHADMGYPHACAMFDTWRAKPLAAVRGFFRYLETSGLIAPLRQKQWTEFAMGYNGLGNHDYYADRLARAVTYMESAAPAAPALARRTVG